jgi:glycosyltransferase involved in cell wall biosynthesis
VVALGRGGALETVRQNETGLLVQDLSTEAFGHAVAQAVHRKFDANAIRQHAEQFGRERFGNQMEDLVRQSADQSIAR